MRKIEQEMIDAIHMGRSWSKDNTRIQVDENQTAAWVYLHENHIGTYNYKECKFYPNTATLRRFPTNTTKSRLRALGVKVTQRNWELYIDGEKL